MKKVKLIAILAIALTSVFAFTSCDKNDDETNPNAGNKKKESFFYVPTSVEQLNYIDASYTLNVDGKTVNVKLLDMTEVKDFTSDKDLISVKNSVEDNAQGIPFKIYSYSLGEIKDAKYVSAHYTKIAETDHPISVIWGHLFLFSGGNCYSAINVFRDVEGVQNIVNVLNEKE